MHDNVKTIYTHIYYINKYVTYIYIYMVASLLRRK